MKCGYYTIDTNEPYSGPVFRLDNGKKFHEGTLKDGKWDKDWVYWRDNGQKMSEESYNVGSRWMAYNYLVEGDTVVVLQKFNTNDEEETPLVIGTKLQVIKIDEDGDANMKQLHGEWTCWIFSSNFRKLKIIDKNDKTDYLDWVGM